MASKINKGEILAKFFDDGEYTALFADGAVSAACGYAAGQQAYAVYQNGEAVTVKDVEKNIKVLEMAAQTGCPVVTFYNSVGAKLAEGLDVLTANAKLNAQIAKVSGVIPQVAVVLGVCGGTSALSAANADVCIMAEGAELFFTAPFTSAAKGDKVADAGTAAAADTQNNSHLRDHAGNLCDLRIQLCAGGQHVQTLSQLCANGVIEGDDRAASLCCHLQNLDVLFNILYGNSFAVLVNSVSLLTCRIAAGSAHCTVSKQCSVFPVIKKLGEDFSLIDL